MSSITTAQNPLAIPPQLTGTTFELNLQNGSRTFFPGTVTNTMGVNGDLLGPTLVLNSGDEKVVCSSWFYAFVKIDGKTVPFLKPS